MYVSIEGQGHFFTIYFPGLVCFVLYWAKISGERLHDHWSSGYFFRNKSDISILNFTVIIQISFFYGIITGSEEAACIRQYM